jgi:hypothetical protein
MLAASFTLRVSSNEKQESGLARGTDEEVVEKPPLEAFCVDFFDCKGQLMMFVVFF